MSLHVNSSTGEVEAGEKAPVVLHVIFTPDGIPGHISADPHPQSEPVEGLDLAFLIAHRRTETGEWVARDPAPVWLPSAEEVAAQAEAERREADALRDAAVREALAAEADPLFFKWQRDEATRAEWLAKVAEVKARFA